MDELPIIVGVRMRGLTPVHVTLGSQNVGGRALTAALTTQRGDGYRPGIGLRLVQYAALGRPYTATASARRNPLGGAWALELAHPFLTDREPVAFHVGAQASREYYPVVTPVQGDLAISVRRASFNVGAVTRVGQGDVTGAVGGALLGENVRTAGGPVIVSDSGLVPVPADSGLAGRLQAFRVVRLAGIGGVRALRFVTVRGFDALTAEQDMGEGVQFAALAGPSMLSSTIRRDVFLSTDLYAGIGDARSFVSVRVIGEGRANRTTHRWSNVVTDARLVWYAMPMDRTTQVVNVDFSGVQALVYPLQLTFRDRDGGLRGYPDATFAGGRRAVLRIEERRLLPPLGRRADVAVSAFADAGRLWAGDVPYGVTTGMHTALGVSLQAAVPIGGKRTYRLDIALPLNRLPGSARWELRFTSADRAQTLWHEPADLVRARAGGIPANLLNWLSR